MSPIKLTPTTAARPATVVQLSDFHSVTSPTWTSFSRRSSGQDNGSSIFDHRPALIPSSVPWTLPTSALIFPVQTPTLSSKLPPLSSCPLLWISALALPQKPFAPHLRNSWNPGSPSGCLQPATPVKDHAPLPLFVRYLPFGFRTRHSGTL
jgi:hypothetical protein